MFPLDESAVCALKGCKLMAVKITFKVAEEIVGRKIALLTDIISEEGKNYHHKLPS